MSPFDHFSFILQVSDKLCTKRQLLSRKISWSSTSTLGKRKHSPTASYENKAHTNKYWLVYLKHHWYWTSKEHFSRTSHVSHLRKQLVWWQKTHFNRWCLIHYCDHNGMTSVAQTGKGFFFLNQLTLITFNLQNT